MNQKNFELCKLYLANENLEKGLNFVKEQLSNLNITINNYKKNLV